MLHYTATGRGEITLVFLHYFGGSAHTWQPVTRLLEQSFRCICIDLPGFGASAAPERSPTVKNSEEAVTVLLQHLQLSRFILIGHSMGGKLALMVAAAQPAGLQGLVLLAPSPFVPEPMSAKDRQRLDEAWGDEEKTTAHLRQIIAAPVAGMDLAQTIADNLQVSSFSWQGWLYIGSKEDLSAYMHRIMVPLTIVTGSEDTGLSAAVLYRIFHPRFPEAVFMDVKDCGHLLPLEKPEETAAIIRKSATAISVNEA